jgi:GNAT superfamily N-acetyltransferase
MELPQVIVRPAAPEDAPKLARIQTESWKAAFADILTVETLACCTDLPRCTEMLRGVLESRSGTFYLAERDGSACGSLFWRRDAEPSGCAEIVALHSLRESWGSDVGRALMERALADIAAAGNRRVFLWVFADNHRARRFYEKCGFSLSGDSHTSRFDGALELCFEKQI